NLQERPAGGIYQHVRASDATMAWLASDSGLKEPGLKDPFMVQVDVSTYGRVIDYDIISGPKSPAVERWLKQILSFAEFTPATSFGKPVTSRIILSVVAVRG